MRGCGTSTHLHYHSLQHRVVGRSSRLHAWHRQCARRLYSYRPHRACWRRHFHIGRACKSSILQFPAPKSPLIVTLSLAEGKSCLLSPYAQLTMRKFGPGGSYIEKIELKDPIGPFGGYWITLDSQGVFQNVTYIVWSVYGCSKGHPQGMRLSPGCGKLAVWLLIQWILIWAVFTDYAAFYELAQQNITDVLTKQGKFVGPNVDPISIQSFGNYPGKNKCFGFHPDTGPVGTCVRKNWSSQLGADNRIHAETME